MLTPSQRARILTLSAEPIEAVKHQVLHIGPAPHFSGNGDDYRREVARYREHLLESCNIAGRSGFTFQQMAGEFAIFVRLSIPTAKDQTDDVKTTTPQMERTMQEAQTI